MPILKIILLFALPAILLFSHPGRANDHEAPKEEHGSSEGHGESAGHGEAEAKEGGGEHGEKAAAPSAPWVPVENKIQELHAKIKSKEANILKLLEEKNHLQNGSAQLKTTVAELLKEHKEMRSLAEEYQKNVSILKYRFPERNAKSGRSYDRIEVKSIDEMEQAMGVDGKLNRNLKRMRAQFESGEKTPAGHSEELPTVKKKVPVKEKSIEEADTVILHK